MPALDLICCTLWLFSADFGFARFLQSGVMAGTLCGSPMYMVLSSFFLIIFIAMYMSDITDITLLCLFSEVASRLSSSGVPSHDFHRNICSDCTVTVVIFRHLNHSFYLLTYLLTYLLNYLHTDTDCLVK